MNAEKLKALQLLTHPVLLPDHAIPCNVKLYVTDVMGQIIDKLDPAYPVIFKQPMPFILFGAFDLKSGYSIAQRVTNIPPGVSYIFTYVHGLGLPFLSFTGLNQIITQLNLGDVVQVYTDNIQAPTNFAFIVISCGGQIAYSSILENTMSSQADHRIGGMKVVQTDYFVGSGDLATLNRQLEHGIDVVFTDNIGTYNKDTISPNSFKSPFNKLDDLIDLKTSFDLDQYIMLTGRLNFAVEYVLLNFKILTNVY